MKILDETQPLEFTIDPTTVYISTNPDHSSYANITVTVNNTSGADVSVNSFAITLPTSLAPTSSLNSITPTTNTPSLWSFAPSDINTGEFDATSQSGSNVTMGSTDSWQFELQMVTLNNTDSLPSSADVTAKVTYGNGSSYQQPLTVSMDAATQSIISFNSQPSEIEPGSSATLQWQCDEIAYCELSPGDGSHLDASGTKDMSPLETTIYTLYAYADSVILSAQWAISVDNPQVIKFGGQDGQTNLDLGQSITLVWECNQYTNSIALTANTDITIPDLLANGNTVTKGSVLVGPVNAPTNFTFTASGSNISNFNESSTLISINDVTASLVASPDSDIWEKDSVTLTWNIQSASSVTLTPPMENGPSMSNLSGSVVINPTEDITYTLEATGFINNLSNSASAPLSLDVAQVQISSFTISPEQITPDVGSNAATLGWAAQAQVLTIDNGVGDVTGTSSYPLNAPPDGTVYTLSAGTNQNPGILTATVQVINAFGPYTFTSFADDPTLLCVQDLIVPKPGSMQYLLQGIQGSYTAVVTGVNITSTPSDGSLGAMVNYAVGDPAQSFVYLMYWPFQPNNTRLTVEWADPDNPSGTVTLTGVPSSLSQVDKDRYRTVFLSDDDEHPLLSGANND